MTENEHVVDDEDRALLRELLEAYRVGPVLPEVIQFRTAHHEARRRLDELQNSALIIEFYRRYGLTFDGLLACQSPEAKAVHAKCRELLSELQRAYLRAPTATWRPGEFTQSQFFVSHEREQEAARLLTLLTNGGSGLEVHHLSPNGFLERFGLKESILDAHLPDWPDESVETDSDVDENPPRIDSIDISGYRPFAGFSAPLGNLTVIIGANASGKSSLFDALRLLSFAVENPLAPGIDPRLEAATTPFHVGGPERIDLGLTAHVKQKKPLRYEVSIQGPVGSPRVGRERLATTEPLREGDKEPFVYLDFVGGKGVVRNPRERSPSRPAWSVAPNELALRRALDPTLVTLSRFQAFVAAWRFYGGFDVSQRAALRRPAHIEENPILAEDGANLSAVLGSMTLEHREAWEELETALRAAIPGFESLSVRPRGGRGMAIAVWRERGLTEELTLGDLSEGTLRLLCWLALAYSPNLPPVICIDEPELGLHPRVLPILAGAFKLASSRAQILIATHSPHFLSHFDLDDIAVMRKEDGRAVFVRPASSEALRREVDEIGGEAIAKLFISEELEVLP